MRESVKAATAALQRGDWAEAEAFVRRREARSDHRRFGAERFIPI